MKNKLVCGIGINDCPKCEKHIRVYWKNMVVRCYSSKYQAKKPTYKGCSVDPSWLKLSNFRTWFLQSNYKQGLHLDKDILNKGNKVYSPDNCSFVSQRINSLLIDSGRTRGSYKVGVYFHKPTGKFLTRCSVNGKLKHLGLFNTETEAFTAYKLFKETQIKIVAEEEYQLDNCTKEIRDALLGWTI